MNLSAIVAEALVPQNMQIGRFQEIVCRLYAWGIVLRDEGGIEQRLYDDAIRIEPLLRGYFELAGFRLVHDQRGEFFRLYPPGAEVPGEPDDEAMEPYPALRSRLSADFIAAAIALRFLYQKGLTEGAGTLTEQGNLLVRFDELALTLQTQLRRALPDSLSERERLMRDLKRHRLISYEASFEVGAEESLFAIRPVVLSIVTDDALLSALGDPGSEVDEVSDEA